MEILRFVLFVVTKVILNNVVLNTKLSLKKITQKEPIKLFRGTSTFLEKIVCPNGLIEILFTLLIKTKNPS